MNRRFALQALLALGGGLCSRSVLADPNFGARAPAGAEDVAGSLAVPEPLFAAPTRLDRIGRVMTTVKVNGKGPFRFVIDTGASRSTLAPHLARTLNLKPSVGRNVMLNGVTGAAEVPTVAVDSIEIGALRFEQQNLPVIFTSIMGNADGILGVAGFKDQRIDADFKRDRVAVLESNGRRDRRRAHRPPAQGQGRHRHRRRALARQRRAADRTEPRQEEARGRGRGGPRRDAGHRRWRSAGHPRSAHRRHDADQPRSDLWDFHVFKLWGLDKEPALLIGMDMLGVLDRLVIDYRRNEVSMFGAREAWSVVQR
jgi:hypothetical protein